MPSADMFNEDYYKYGIHKGLSLYDNFRWMPEKSFPIAMQIVDTFLLTRWKKTLLDYGCGFGFVVRALRAMGIEAFGYDFSAYAISQAPEDIKEFVTTEKGKYSCDIVFIKDVLEHCDYNQIEGEIRHIYDACKETLIVIIPFGDNGKYRIADYEKDITHIIKEDEIWWLNLFQRNGFVLDWFSYDLTGYKDNWQQVNRFGNGLFIFIKGKE